MPIIIENLTHTYMPGSVTQFTALHDINLTVEDGEFFGIIGHTGSGKSTFAKHLNAILLPTGGAVYIDNMDTRDEELLLAIARANALTGESGWLNGDGTEDRYSRRNAPPDDRSGD